MKIINVNLGARSYSIYVGHNLQAQPAVVQACILSRQLMVVSNQTVAKLYLEQWLTSLTDAKPRLQLSTVILPDGEQYKNLATLEQIYDQLTAQKYTRDATLIALGGGVVGDMTGFAAATYMRGINYVQIPTTLLAQVDSSVGGKTAVNHSRGKNLVGAFYQPKAVLIDTQVLGTLANREFYAGLAEVLKYGLIADAKFFVWLEQNWAALMARESTALQYAIARSCQIKADIVQADEYESGCRAILNFGHTFGHAIENALGYGQWLHGEAVALGMLMALRLACKCGLIDASLQERTKHLLQQVQLPTSLPANVSATALLELMRLDKKVLGNKQRLILLTALGRARVYTDVASEQITAILSEFIA